jgi:phosphoribosylformylglycinamidine synthase
LTPELRLGTNGALVLVDLSGGRARLGGSCLAQSAGEFGGEPPDVDEPALIEAFAHALAELRHAKLVHAYHDRSDGGLIVTLLEMAFASHAGLDVHLPDAAGDVVEYLFNEELGAVIEVPSESLEAVLATLARAGCRDAVAIGAARADQAVVVSREGAELYRTTRPALHAVWSELTFRMQALRDDPECAAEAYESTIDADDPGLNAELTFEIPTLEDRPGRRGSAGRDARPRVAVLREQGVNGQREMAAALDRAGFEAVDVHMSDLVAGSRGLAGLRGLVACGGFSYGDVLGAGEGWAKSILHKPELRDMFAEFFARTDVFGLGVCNGCQMLAALKALIPGARHWPRFLRNRSDQFEARLSLARIEPSASILLTGMAGSRLPVVTSHGEGRAEFSSDADLAEAERSLTALRYVDNRGEAAERYPANPNGSPRGIAGLTSADGRVTIMMPHPERVFRTVQMSWHPREWGECSPWQRLFDNARAWV